MSVVTEAQRVQRVKELLEELTKQPPEKQHATIEVPGPGGEARYCKVITIEVDNVVLNPHSHRVRSQLEDDPEWEKHKHDPHGEAAQRIIQRLVREARSPDAFAALKDSLGTDGQQEPGVVTSKGVLINANTRAVALRELDDPHKRVIKAAVLPDTWTPEQLSLLELHLQMQRELKVEYSLTNELLFIEELHEKLGMSEAQIAKELRIEPGSSTKGEKEVRTRLRLLDLVRTLQRLPTEPLRLTFFDDIRYEQLRELDREYSATINSDPIEAALILETFLLAIAVEVTSVHTLRKIDIDFIPDYVLPELEEDGGVGAQIAVLAEGAKNEKAPDGVGALLGEFETTGEANINLKNLIDAATQRDHKVPVPGTDVVLEKKDVKDALKAAIAVGIKKKGRDSREEDRLEAPVAHLSDAVSAASKCVDACAGVIQTDQFGTARRKSLEVKFKKLRKTVKALEQELSEAGLTTK